MPFRRKPPSYFDYSSDKFKDSKLPILDNVLIHEKEVDLGKRLGGGLFGDTYIAEWKGRKLAAKRIIICSFKGMTDRDFKRIKDNITFFR